MKIWYFGKVYDLDQMKDVDIEKDIEARIEEFTGKVIGVSVKPTDDGYEVIIHRSLNVEVKDGLILEPDTFIISGEGYSGFMPEYQSIGNFAHFPGFVHYLDLHEFEKACKRNVEYYTGQKVKKATVTEWINMLVLDVKF